MKIIQLFSNCPFVIISKSVNNPKANDTKNLLLKSNVIKLLQFLQFHFDHIALYKSFLKYDTFEYL